MRKILFRWSVSSGLRWCNQKINKSKASVTVKRYCLTLDLKNDPALIAKYKYYHSDEGIWNEIKDGTRNVGMEMEIYNVDNRLFMICEVPNEFIREKTNYNKYTPNKCK
jgi:hypothetical protein